LNCLISDPANQDLETIADYLGAGYGLAANEKFIDGIALTLVAHTLRITENFELLETMALADGLIERDKQIKLEGAQAERTAIARTMLQKPMSFGIKPWQPRC
jgi:hypothetical protein